MTCSFSVLDTKCTSIRGLSAYAYGVTEVTSIDQATQAIDVVGFHSRTALLLKYKPVLWRSSHNSTGRWRLHKSAAINPGSSHLLLRSHPTLTNRGVWSDENAGSSARKVH